MKRWALVMVLGLSLSASGCMTLGVALTDPKKTAPSQVIAGGILGDAALAALGSVTHAELDASLEKPASRFWTYFLVLAAVDAVGAGVVWYLKRDRGSAQ